MPKASPMTLEDAETLALTALAFLAEDGPRLGRFLSLTGMDPGELRAHAGTRQTQAAILEHMLADESLLLVFAASRGIKPETLAPALSILMRASPTA